MIQTKHKFGGLNEHTVSDDTIVALKRNKMHAHTSTGLTSLFLLTLYTAVTRLNYEYDTSNNFQLGTWIAIACFACFGMLQFPDGPFVRPSKFIWRAVLSISVLYQLCLLLLLLCMDKHQARQFLKNFDPSLGVNFYERSYATTCDLTFKNLVNQIDFFVVAHAVGWFGKALILRDYWLCWILSVGFELCEYSLAHQLNGFAECWWDHWILDVLICNWLGIVIGLKFCEYFNLKEYHWIRFLQIKPFSGNVKTTVQQYRWCITTSPKYYFGTVLSLIMFLQCELNCFYLKFLLWIPPSHPLNAIRLTFIFLFALPGARDIYEYISNPNSKRMGWHAWLLILNIMTESLICLQFSSHEFHNTTSMIVKVSWSTFFLISLVIFPLWRFVIRPVKTMSGHGLVTKKD